MQVRTGSVAPYALVVECVSERPDSADEPYFDVSGATVASFLVRRESGVEEIWSATVVVAEVIPNGSRVLLSHTYALGDLPIAEILRVVAKVEIGAGPIYSETFSVSVVPLF